jgi:hypothetical protein
MSPPLGNERDAVVRDSIGSPFHSKKRYISGGKLGVFFDG